MTTVTYCSCCGSFLPRHATACRKGCAGFELLTGDMDVAMDLQSAARKVEAAKAAEIAAAKAAAAAAMPAPEPEAMVLITGDTYPVRGVLAEMGGTFDRAAQGWRIPASKADRARRLVGPAPAWKRAGAPSPRRCGCGQCMACIGE